MIGLEKGKVVKDLHVLADAELPTQIARSFLEGHEWRYAPVW